MGEVWVAQQTAPVKRRVALKLIKPGMDSRGVVQRFEAERQALALMDHPHIAKVLDGGLTPTGQPFFVMELVAGLPLTQFCDEAALSLTARLELFLHICQAVQHAHHKGIVHRDLKPGNILVTRIDGQPVPKVIDFGVAKAIGNKLTDASLATHFGTVIGTLEYMAPEQTGLSGLDIDTRADIYSLGVILYEMLTGLRPMADQRLQSATIPEVIRMIQEEEPARPSTRLATAETLPTLAAARQTEPKKLLAMLRGELDWIVLKCLEKDRNRRYVTVNALAQDIEHYLADEPVEARPPSFGYRAGKFLRRHRGAVAAAILLLLVLVAGIAGTTWGLIEAKHHEGLANERAERERQARLAEAAAAAQAQARAAQLTRGNELLNGIFAELDLGKMKQDKLPLETVLAKRLLQAARQLEGEAVGDPLVVAKLQQGLAKSLRNLGHAPEAVALYEKCLATQKRLLGPEDEETLTTCNDLASALGDVGQLERGLQLLRETLQTLEAKTGRSSGLWPVVRINLAALYVQAGQVERAIPLLEETFRLAKQQVGLEDPGTLSCLNNLAAAYRAAGRLDKALPLLEQALELRKKQLGPDHLDTLLSMNNLGMAYKEAGKPRQALKLLEETFTRQKAVLGPEHPDTLTTMNNVALAHHEAGQTDRAIALFTEALRLCKATLGADHHATLAGMSNLGMAYYQTGQLARALPLLEEVRTKRQQQLGLEHPVTLEAISKLALAYQQAGKTVEALALHEQTLALRKKLLGPTHADTLESLNNLGTIYYEQRQFDKSIPLFVEILRVQERRLGRSHHDTLFTMGNLGVNYRDAGRLTEAIALLEEVHRAVAKYPDLRAFSPELFEAYARAGRTAQAAAMAKTVVADFRQTMPPESSEWAAFLAIIGHSLLSAQAWDDAEPLLRECLAIRQQRQPNDWATFNTQAMLGGALLGQKKYADAEPLLLKGYEGMKHREKTIPPQGKVRLTEALERLMQLYEATDKKGEAAKWRRELERTKAAQAETEP